MQLSTGMILSDLMRWQAAFLAAVQDRDCSHNTLTLYRRVTTEIIAFAEQVQAEITMRDLNTYFFGRLLAAKADNVATGSNQAKTFSTSSKQTYITVIKCFLRFIEEQNDDCVAMLKNVTNLTVQAEHKVKPAYNPQQEDRILLALEKMKGRGQQTSLRNFTTLRNILLTKLLLNTGIRAGELATLRYEEFEPFAGPGGLAMYQFIVTGKGKRQRQVFIECAEIDGELALLKSRFKVSGLIAVSSTGLPLGGVQINHNVSRITNRLGIPNGCHIFRHTFARRLISNGVDPKSVQELLGHSKLQTTLDFYYDANENIKAAAVVKGKPGTGKKG